MNNISYKIKWETDALYLKLHEQFLDLLDWEATNWFYDFFHVRFFTQELYDVLN